jgi:outer membrane protein OmpA-like peptidoglycan-associated protein
MAVLALLLPGAMLAQEMEMKVELMGPLGTKTSRKGDRVFARVVQPDALKGDTVEGSVKEVHSGGKLHGNSVLNFSFETLMHGGQPVPIGTEIRGFHNSKGQAEVDEEGRIIRRGGGNTGKVLGGTAAGGLIGGIAGGWKGAAIGTGVGAAASIAVIEIACDSPEIRFDPGSTITLSAKSRGGPALSTLGAAPATSEAGYPPAQSAAPAYAANTSTGAPAASAGAAPTTPSGASAPAATPASAAAANPGASAQPNFTVLKDDFIPGEKLLLYDDFTDMEPDEAPPHWKVRGTPVTLMGAGASRQIAVGDRTYMTPLLDRFPQNFTVEMDLMFDPKLGGEYAWYFYKDQSNNDALRLGVSTRGTEMRVGARTEKEALMDANFPVNIAEPVKAAIWVQNGRVRAYFNGQKVLDVNHVEIPPLTRAVLLTNDFRSDVKVNYRRIRIAESTPDFSHTIMSAGRYVTYGILFDTNSDRLRPESAAVIKSIATGLQANAALNLKIEGHTDSSGDAALNLDLSKRRAEAVKQVLVAQFQIDAARLSTDGLGATKPLESNDTPQGRAQNRRVEFVKQ